MLTRPDRGHQPDAHLRRTAPANCPGPVRGPLQRTAPPSQPPAPPAPARPPGGGQHQGADPAAGPSSAASSASTSGPHKSPGSGATAGFWNPARCRWRWKPWSCLASSSQRRWLHRLAVETLLVHGADDDVVPVAVSQACAEEMAPRDDLRLSETAAISWCLISTASSPRSSQVIYRTCFGAGSSSPGAARVRASPGSSPLKLGVDHRRDALRPGAGGTPGLPGAASGAQRVDPLRHRVGREPHMRSGPAARVVS